MEVSFELKEIKWRHWVRTHHNVCVGMFSKEKVLCFSLLVPARKNRQENKQTKQSIFKWVEDWRLELWILMRFEYFTTVWMEWTSTVNLPPTRCVATFILVNKTEHTLGKGQLTFVSSQHLCHSFHITLCSLRALRLVKGQTWGTGIWPRTRAENN